ncbi:MAG: branched-chain amino acid ABC transporter permease, partial [Thermodesulfobacteriota bacterium]
ACVPLFLENQYFLQIMIMTFFFAYLAGCWNLVGGGVGLFSMGHAAFVGLGAYTSTILFMHNHLTPWLGMLAGGGTAVVAAIIIGYPCFKLRGVYFSLATLAFVSILQMVITTTRHVGGFDVGAGEGLIIPVLGHSPGQLQFLSKAYYYWIILGMLGLVTWVADRLKASKMGYYMLAIKLDQEAADSLGVNVVKYKLICWCLSAFLTALGGTFYAQLLLYVAPDRLLSIPLSLELIITTLIGGIGTIAGPIIGAFILIPIGEILRMQLGGQYALVQVIIYGTILIAIILFLPKGIKEPLENMCKRIRRALAGPLS